MKSATCTVSIDAPSARVFRFVADIENLPRWAVEFCRGLRKRGADWLVRTSEGEIPCRIDAHAASGAVDFVLSPAPGVESPAFSRVVPRGPVCDYVFTFHQAPGMPDAVFAGQKAALEKELQVLKGLMEKA